MSTSVTTLSSKRPSGKESRQRSVAVYTLCSVQYRVRASGLADSARGMMLRNDIMSQDILRKTGRSGRYLPQSDLSADFQVASALALPISQEQEHAANRYRA